MEQHGGIGFVRRPNADLFAADETTGISGPGTINVMRAVIQRVSRAQVTVDGEVIGKIAHGLLVLLGVARTDTSADADYLAGKIAGLRIFEDATGKMNLSVEAVKGAVLVVSQFTLYGDVSRGKRPSFDDAAHQSRPTNFMNILCNESARLAFLRNRPFPGHDASGIGERWASNNLSGLGQNLTMVESLP